MDEWGLTASATEARPARAHLVGVAGGGMAGLAQVLAQRGSVVSGSGVAPGPAADRLARMGVRFDRGPAPVRVPPGTHLLVHGQGVGRDHPERVAALRKGIPQATRCELLGRLARGRLGVAVAGRRSAGVAGAMVGWALLLDGQDPTILLGKPVPQLGGWGRSGAGPHLIVEATDSAEDLAAITPVAVLSLDWAGQGDPEALRALVESIPEGGCVVGLDGDPALRAAMAGSGADRELISLEPGSTWWGADLREDRGRYRFRAFHRGRFVLEARLRTPGPGNVLSALAATALGSRLGLKPEALKEGLEEFAGVSRGFESRGSYRGVTLVDDEARDPSAIAEALRLGRRLFGSRRLWAVLGVEADDEGPPGPATQALAEADRVLLVAGPTRKSRAAAEALAEALADQGRPARAAVGLDDAVADLDRQLEPGDVVLTLGAGDVGSIADALTGRLSRDRQAD